MKKELEQILEKQYYDKEQDLWVVSVNHVQRVLTPPTSDEVCNALSKYFSVDNGYHYDKEYKWFTRESGVVIWLLPNGQLNIHMDLPPHLITLIGRFYQSLEEENV